MLHIIVIKLGKKASILQENYHLLSFSLIVFKWLINDWFISETKALEKH